MYAPRIIQVQRRLLMPNWRERTSEANAFQWPRRASVHVGYVRHQPALDWRPDELTVNLVSATKFPRHEVD